MRLYDASQHVADMSNTCLSLGEMAAKEYAGNYCSLDHNIECTETARSLGSHLLVDLRVGPPLDLKIRR